MARRCRASAEVQFLVLPDISHPFLLARVRWPDVFEAISPTRPDWRADPGLFDLPYDASSTRVTRERAAAIASNWGAGLPDDERSDQADATPRPSLIRRMPANWSDLSPAEKRLWSINCVEQEWRAAAGEPRRWRWRRRRQEVSPVLGNSELPHEERTLELDAERAEVIDLTVAAAEVAHLTSATEDVIDLAASSDDALATVED
jgi:hypothetical protein